jgi:LysR family transcriptional regulator, transcriptional activator of nhaA
MQWLNYHHLYYFWMVVRLGSISKASQALRLSPPAISAQLHSLEESLGEKLLARSGRNLTPTEMGRVVFSYGEEIFSLGRELMTTLRDRPAGRPLRLVVGVVDGLPKMIAHWLIQPALRVPESVRIVCRQGSFDQLMSQLAVHELDVVLSDAPSNPNFKIKAYSRLLGECGTIFLATEELAKTLNHDFPHSLDAAPLLVPTENSAVRRSLDSWLSGQAIHPVITGEFQDYALLRAFGEAGAGIFLVPSVFEGELKQQDSLKRIGSTDEVRHFFYAISVDRKIKHPAVVRICNTACLELSPRPADAA